eukprot:Seg2926.3 transcript_id=Seg2926.3/GoldUCD/mRNA.D3Y31 product="Gamma-glutamyl peptidase 3" protein_id=Seg2926.3/GoldUCD/D3Y31
MARVIENSTRRLRIGMVACEDLAKWGGRDVAKVAIKLFTERGLGQQQQDGHSNSDGPNSDTQIDFVPLNAVFENLPDQNELKQFDGFVLTGSHYSVNDKEEWIAKYEEWVRKLKYYQDNNSNPPRVVAVCFSHQLVNKALGGKVGKNPNGNFVWNAESVKLTEDAANHPFFKHLKDDADGKSFKLYESHGDGVLELPPGAKNLGSSESCEHEIVSIGDDMITIQSHPEFGEEEMVDKILPAIRKSNLITEEYSEQSIESFKSGLDGEAFMKIIKNYFSKI